MLGLAAGNVALPIVDLQLTQRSDVLIGQARSTRSLPRHFHLLQASALADALLLFRF